MIVNQLIGVVIWAGRKGTQRQNQGDQVFPAGNNNWKYATTSSVLDVWCRASGSVEAALTHGPLFFQLFLTHGPLCLNCKVLMKPLQLCSLVPRPTPFSNFLGYRSLA